MAAAWPDSLSRGARWCHALQPDTELRSGPQWLQVADRLIGCMGKPQLARLATVAFMMPDCDGEAVGRISRTAQAAVPQLCAADVLQLCNAVAMSAHRDGCMAMALATHLLGGKTGVPAAKALTAMRAFRREGFLLPVEVQGRLQQEPRLQRYQLRDVMADVERPQPRRNSVGP